MPLFITKVGQFCLTDSKGLVQLCNTLAQFYTVYTVSQNVSVTAASEQHKLSKSEVGDKVIPVADFWMSADGMSQKL